MPKPSEAETAADVFNRLSPMPAKPLDLGDGRVLELLRWRPAGDANTATVGAVEVRVVAVIRAKKPGE